LGLKELNIRMKNLNTQYSIPNTQYRPRGVVALITILSLGTLVFIISLATSILAFWAIKNIDATQKSLKTYYAAYSGVQDALIKLERNKDFKTIENFEISVNSANVSVSVSNDLDGHATTTSTAVLGKINKKIQTITDINSTTGLITPTSTIELTL